MPFKIQLVDNRLGKVICNAKTTRNSYTLQITLMKQASKRDSKQTKLKNEQKG